MQSILRNQDIKNYNEIYVVFWTATPDSKSDLLWIV